jgi:hypothetical protein
LDYEQAAHIVEMQVQRQDGGGEGEWHSGDSVKYPAGKSSTWKVKVKPPPALQGNNMQYVVEAQPIFNDGSTSGAKEAAKFTYPKMCDGKRSFGRNYDEAVTVEFNGQADSVEIWAAWAIGFGQVSLTPKLTLLQGDEEEEEL